jgi:hypothetical protein
MYSLSLCVTVSKYCRMVEELSPAAPIRGTKQALVSGPPSPSHGRLQQPMG